MILVIQFLKSQLLNFKANHLHSSSSCFDCSRQLQKQCLPIWVYFSRIICELEQPAADESMINHCSFKIYQTAAAAGSKSCSWGTTTTTTATTMNGSRIMLTKSLDGSFSLHTGQFARYTHKYLVPILSETWKIQQSRNIFQKKCNQVGVEKCFNILWSNTTFGLQQPTVKYTRCMSNWIGRIIFGWRRPKNSLSCRHLSFQLASLT